MNISQLGNIKYFNKTYNMLTLLKYNHFFFINSSFFVHHLGSLRSLYYNAHRPDIANIHEATTLYLLIRFCYV